MCIRDRGMVCAMFIAAGKKDTFLFPNVHLLTKSRWNAWKDVARIGLPVALQSIFFSFLSMVIARLVAAWGDAAIAAQKVGSQIESISFTTAEGFGLSLIHILYIGIGAIEHVAVCLSVHIKIEPHSTA